MLKRVSIIAIGLLVLIAILSACATPTPETITVIETVEKEVQVEVEKTVEVEVIKEVEKIVEVTPEAVEYWTPEEVTPNTGPEACVPVASLPKQLSDDYLLAFINVLKSHPFHGVVYKGIEAAAAFYGADLIDGDTAGAGGTAAIEMGNTLLLDKPDVIGIIGQGPDTRDPIAQAAYDAGTIFLSIDSGRSEWSPYVYVSATPAAV